MMRALWTAASGMKAQQFNVDVISNNLSNVNTTGYKKERAEFKDLLYQTIDRAYVLGQDGKPTNLQVGHGTTVVSTVKNFSGGNLEETGNALDMAIDGDAFFMVKGPTGDTVYTRDGSFKASYTEEGNKLTTSDGYPVLDDGGNEIILTIDPSQLNVSQLGELSYTGEDGAEVPLGQTMGLVKFPNRYALESMGKNLYKENSATGAAVTDSELGTRSTITQSFLESSNVQVVEEMVKLIVAQRAYEVNSKSIQSSDEMLGMANNLRR
jgi:flagellar basal-body rod protein FlgG